MALIEVSASGHREDTRNQRWANYLTLAFIAVGLLVGLYLRDAVLYATATFIDSEAGIQAEYPAGWLIDFDGDYIFRVRDMSRVGFKTIIEVAVRPYSADMSPRNVFDDLGLQRPSTRTGYTERDRRQTILPDGEIADLIEYSFVFAESDPFFAPLQVVVLGQDVLVVRRGQAILLTFIADANTFDQDYAIFERFLASLDL
jgi:hypothetical protein